MIFRKKGRYHGPVVYVNGVHYPCDKNGHAVKKHPLRWDDDGYRYAGKNDPTHEHVYGMRPVELPVGGE